MEEGWKSKESPFSCLKEEKGEEEEEMMDVDGREVELKPNLARLSSFQPVSFLRKFFGSRSMSISRAFLPTASSWRAKIFSLIW